VAAHPLLAPGVASGASDDTVGAAWTAVVYQIARESGADVLGPPTPPTVGRNYYQALLRQTDGRRVRLLLHGPARLVAAAAEDAPGRLDAPFVDVPRPDLFNLAGLRVLTPKELEEPLTDDKMVNLRPSERRDIAYHAPTRIGDVIFNWFD
jgi:hypothetical protein